MWTNVFRIGGLQQVSWFQFLPNDSDFTPLPDHPDNWSAKADHKDAATWLLLSAHLHLQKEGFLTTWTNSFVGPWDPSQGSHNPDEKIKLWLFLPGRHSSPVQSAQAVVSRLRVVASGVWLAPGDSEEVAAALSQSLKNCVEKALLGQSFMRFGDVFTKYYSAHSGGFSRRGQPTLELVFNATEDAIFVHVIVSAKNIRALSSSDMNNVLKHSSNSASCRFPVIVAPYGLRGWLTGCCPNELVKQVYFSSGKFKASNGLIGLPHHNSQGPGCQLWGQNCHAEVTLGCPRPEGDKAVQAGSDFTQNLPKNHVVESPARRTDHFQKGSADRVSEHQKTFIYPAEAVVVPIQQTLSAASSLKRFWLQNWTGPSVSGSSLFMHCGGDTGCFEGNMGDIYGTLLQHDNNSSSNSNSSSLSSISSSSSDSDHMMATEAGDLDADADSLSCHQSGLSFNDQFENDGLVLGSKRLRSGAMEPFGQVGMGKAASVQDSLRSDFGSMEVNNSTITGFEPFGSNFWGDDGDVHISIEALLAEFGDFGSFFETDDLDFGEPPGTAESQVPMFSASDCGEMGSSPIGVRDAVDQMLLPIGVSSFESFNNPPLSTAMDKSLSKNHEIASSTMASGPLSYTPSSMGEFDHLIKAEALMTFAPEYGAVEAPGPELYSSIFRSPYCPKSRKMESSNSSTSNYAYRATPPSSPSVNVSEEKNGIIINPKTAPGRHEAKKYYTHVESGKKQRDKRLINSSWSNAKSEGMVISSSTFNSTKAITSAQKKIPESTIGAENVPFLRKNIPAIDIECIMFQVSMCRMRHVLLSSSNPLPMNMSRLTGSNLWNQFPGDGSIMTDDISARYEVKKKESIPVRIAGDIDGVLDGHLNAPVGVWRSVGVTKVTKPVNSSSVEAGSSLAHHLFSDEGLLSYGQRQPLQELLNGMSLLVQQATSLVDLALDGCCGDGPFSLLALQEQWRRGFCCGPSSVHAGCGGTLASSHFLDIAGVELVDPLSSDILASTVISLLQSEIKTALKAAFKNLDGPLSVNDWFKGRCHSGDGATISNGSFADSSLSDCKDSSSIATLSVGESICPTQSSAGGSSSLKGDQETSQRRLGQEIELDQLQCSQLRPTPLVIPPPAILIGYQDDWLKTSASSLQLWEKAPFEPYALPKPIIYHVVCPDINPLTSAATDFFQQLGTVYETCKLGTHLPHSHVNEMRVDTGKWPSSGFVLLDCPQSMKIESSNASLVGSISDYFLSLSNGWDLTSYLKSLSKAIKSLKVGPGLSMNMKEGNGGSCTVIYVVCPFPEPMAVLQTIIEASVALGSVSLPLDKERRAALHGQVGKALNCSAAVDEASASNVLVLSGFCIPKLILQIVTVDAIFRVSSPALSELVVLKEIAFTVYNKARRISKGASNDMQSLSLSNRPSSVLPQMASVSGMWKDCIGPRIGGPSLPRDGEIDASLRSGSWDNSWQTRTGGLNGDPNRNGENLLRDDIRYMFEPLFILSEPGSLEHAVTPAAFGGSETSKLLSDDSSGGFLQGVGSAGSSDTGSSSQVDGSEDACGSINQKTFPTLHCCYEWTEDWRWLVCIWTDARGELLDSHVFPFGGISSRQDTKGLQCVFMQVLQQGCQILQACSSPDSGIAKPRDLVISRSGSFFELEYLEWQKAIYAVGGSEVKKWPVQLRRSVQDGMPASNNGASLQQSEMSLLQDGNLPSSPSPLYSPHSKASSFMKGTLGQASARKQLMAGHMVDNPRGMLQWVQSISFATISMDHSLQLAFPTDSPTSGTQGANGTVGPGYLEGFTPIKSLGSASASYILIPSSSMRFLPSTPLQLPTCLTAESPPLAHLLHSKGSAIPLSTGFVVSKAVPSARKDCRSNMGDEWPAILSVNLVDYYGSGNISHEKMLRGSLKQGTLALSTEARDVEIQTRLILESVAAELHALSWMTVSPAYLERRTALPFHCDMVLRLRRLLHFADRELSSQPDRSQV